MGESPVLFDRGEPGIVLRGYKRGVPCEIGVKACHYKSGDTPYWIIYADEGWYESNHIKCQDDLLRELKALSEKYGFKAPNEKQGRLF